MALLYKRTKEKGAVCNGFICRIDKRKADGRSKWRCLTSGCQGGLVTSDALLEENGDMDDPKVAGGTAIHGTKNAPEYNMFIVIHRWRSLLVLVIPYFFVASMYERA